MSSTRLLCLLGLCSWMQSGMAMRRMPARHSEMAANSLVESNMTKAFFCPSLCVPCADGRTIFVSRSKGLLKTVIDLAVTPIAVLTGAVFNPLLYWMAPGYVMAEKLFASSIGFECPDMEVIYFHDGEVEHVDQGRLDSMMKKDDYLAQFKKDLDKLFLFDYVLEQTGEAPTSWDKVKNHFSPKRGQGQLPNILKSYLQHADLFCGSYGEDIGSVREESWLEGVQTTVPFVNWKPFWNKCKALAEADCPAYMEKSGCGWTSKWNCPGQPAGSRHEAKDDGSVGYDCCCTRGLWQQKQAVIKPDNSEVHGS